MLSKSQIRNFLLLKLLSIIILLLSCFSLATENHSLISKNSRYLFNEIKSQSINPSEKINELSSINYKLNTNFLQKKFLRRHGNLFSKIKTTRHRPKINIVEESLCPFCISYSASILRELLNIPNFQNLVNLNFYYFGNSSARYNKEKRRYDFKCQRGPNECYGNGLLTCAKKIFHKENAFIYTLCIFENINTFGQDFDKTNEYCMKENPDELKELNSCVKSKRGNKWMYQDLIFSRDNTYVPYVLFDNVNDRKEQKEFKENPIEYLCGKEYNQIKNKDLCLSIVNNKK